MASLATPRPVTPSSAPSSDVLTPDSNASPATSATEVEERAIYTIDDLLRARAEGDKADEPIVAYPLKGTDYTYYTPREVSCLYLKESPVVRYTNRKHDVAAPPSRGRSCPIRTCDSATADI